MGTIPFFIRPKQVIGLSDTNKIFKFSIFRFFKKKLKFIFISSFHHKKIKMSQSRKVVTVKYTHEEEFLVPKGLDLEDETQVDNWYVEWNVLHIIKADGTKLQIRAGGLTADYEYDFPVCNSEKIIDSDMSECYNDIDDEEEDDIDDEEEAKIQTMEDLKNASHQEKQKLAEDIIDIINRSISSCSSGEEEVEEVEDVKILTMEDLEKASYEERQAFTEEQYPEEIVIEMICYVQNYYMEKFGFDPVEVGDHPGTIANMYCEIRFFEKVMKKR